VGVVRGARVGIGVERPLQLELDLLPVVVAFVLDGDLARSGTRIRTPAIWVLNDLSDSNASASRRSLATTSGVEEKLSMSRGLLAMSKGPDVVVAHSTR
jgi:hypothetical protein